MKRGVEMTDTVDTYLEGLQVLCLLTAVDFESIER